MGDSKNNKPEWAPKGAGDEFASFVMKGMDGPTAISPKAKKKRRQLSVEDYVDGVLNQNRTILARAITLIESNAQAHREMGQEVLQRLLPHAGNSMRVGITGVPGAGKSTFVETLGVKLCEAGKKVAVLAVDPSSSLSGGSILGDKTRMEKLSRDERAFIRPSPSGGTLGGVWPRKVVRRSFSAKLPVTTPFWWKLSVLDRMKPPYVKWWIVFYC